MAGVAGAGGGRWLAAVVVGFGVRGRAKATLPLYGNEPGWFSASLLPIGEPCELRAAELLFSKRDGILAHAIFSLGSCSQLWQLCCMLLDSLHLHLHSGLCGDAVINELRWVQGIYLVAKRCANCSTCTNHEA